MTETTATDVLASFVPVLIRKRLFDKPEPIGKDMERLRASVLFSDISGFTKLAERLGDHGPTGLEELTGALNSYFEPLIACINDHGGDVVKMAGDALIAVWRIDDDDDDDALGRSTIRAVRCGLDVQATLQDYEAGEGIRLTSKVGIDAGDVVVMHVGGVFNRWEMLLAGGPIVGMGLAEKQANPGDVILSPKAWEVARDVCDGETLKDGHVRLRGLRDFQLRRAIESFELPPQSKAAISAYIPAAIRGRLAAGQTAWLAELRKLTVLFVKLPKIDFDAPDSLDRAQAILRGLQTALYRHEGSVNKITVDEKGWALVAALGLPPFSHEDDARRALNAAEAMCAAVAQLGEGSISIGIATGRVYCGVIGGEARREYTVIGRPVNLSARLMQAAYDANRDILCDESTHRAAADSFVFEELPPLILKGLKEPVPAFRPIGKSARCRGFKPTVGRIAELALLNERLDDLEAGRGSLVVLEGDPGIGKSQLVAETVARVEARGWACFQGAADAIERSTPYHAWRDVLGRLLGIEDVDDLETRRARVLERLGLNADLLRLAPLLNEVLALDLPENDLTEHMTGLVRLDNTNDLLLWLLQKAVDRGPTVVVLEDAHWFDSASWNLLSQAALKTAPVLIVATARPQAANLPEDYPKLFELPGTFLLALEPLSAEDSVALAGRRLGVDSLPKEVADLIRQKAQGNPFFSEELAYALRDSKLIEIENGRCRVAAGVNLPAVSIPDHIEGVINNRIDRLFPPQQLALKVASVIGRLFAVRLLRDLYPIAPDREQLPDHLDSLTRLDLIAADEPEPELAYIFRHVITRDVVYGMLPFKRRRELHRAVAEWHERSRPDDLATIAPLLAYHWSGAGEDLKAIDYFELAGRQALRGGSYREAVDFFNEAVSKHARVRAGEETQRVAEWERALGEAWLSLGDLAKSRVHAERSLELLGRPVPGSSRLVPSFLGQLALQLGHRLRTKRQGDEVAARDPSLRTASAAFGLISQLCYYDQNRLLGVYAALRTLNLAEGTTPSSELARASGVMCIAAGLVPNQRLAKLYARNALDLSARLNDLAARAWVLQLTGMYDLGIGHWESARVNLQEAVEINRRIGDWRRWEESSGELARLEYHVGLFEKSAERFREIGDSAKAREHVQAGAWGLHGRAKVLLRLGRVAEALAALDEARAIPEQALGHGDIILREGVRALVHLARDECDLARLAAETAAGFIRRTPPIVSYTLEGYAGVAETFTRIFVESRDPAARRVLGRAASQAVRALEGSARFFPVGKPRAALCRGRLLWARGRASKALLVWKRGLKLAEALSMPFEQALLLHAVAQALDPADPARRETFFQAISLFERLGAQYDLARAGIALEEAT